MDEFEQTVLALYSPDSSPQLRSEAMQLFDQVRGEGQREGRKQGGLLHLQLFHKGGEGSKKFPRSFGWSGGGCSQERWKKRWKKKMKWNCVRGRKSARKEIEWV